MQPSAFIADAMCKHHDPGWNHPESPARFDAIVRELQNSGLWNELDHLSARAATKDEVALCHDPAYIELTKREIQQGMTQLSTGDTAVSYRSFEVALHAVGSALAAVDAVCSGSARNAFCVVRPPGHHATRDRGMGFCIFNNIAVAARYAQKTSGFQRILIVDWDVHHGNGTQDIFYDDPSVFYFSTHQAPLYPFTGWETETGIGAGSGSTLNIALPPGSQGDEAIQAFRDTLLPAMDTFRPELILISAGFDAHANDPVSHLEWQTDDFCTLTTILMQVAADHADQRIVSVLEGGYNLHNLAASVSVHLSTLLNYNPAESHE